MSYNLLAGGYRDTYASLTFEPTSAKLKIGKISPGPKNGSWIEPAATKSTGVSSVLYSLSEDPKTGAAVSLELKGEDIKVTSERSTGGAPAHIHAMKDGSGVIAGNYSGGSIVFFPIEANGQLSSTSESPLLKFPFTYEGTTAPNKERQDESHPHEVVEGDNGVLYVPDLGSDRVWVVEREGVDALAIKGYLTCPGGSGPRHCVLSADRKHLYVLTELHSTIFVFSLDNPTYPAHPMPDFELSIVPPTIPSTHAKYMDAAELAYHPSIPNVLYASNRGELHLGENTWFSKPDQPSDLTGDAVAIVLLSSDGAKVEQIKHVRTECDFIRAMSVSPDGKFVALAGQKGGGVEVWAISGDRGDEWKLAAKNADLEMVTDLVWV